MGRIQRHRATKVCVAKRLAVANDQPLLQLAVVSRHCSNQCAMLLQFSPLPPSLCAAANKTHFLSLTSCVPVPCLPSMSHLRVALAPVLPAAPFCLKLLHSLSHAHRSRSMRLRLRRLDRVTLTSATTR